MRNHDEEMKHVDIWSELVILNISNTHTSYAVLAATSPADAIFILSLPHISIFDGMAVHTGNCHTLDQEWHHQVDTHNKFHNP